MNALEARFLVDIALAARNAVFDADPEDTYGAAVPCTVAAVQRGAELLLEVDAERAWRIAFACAASVLLDD
jgi:hypothetical protein